jgi:hypothetical protein
MIGGLGNQLFQLQYGLKFAEQTGSRIVLDDSFLRDSGKAHEVLGFPELFNRFEVHTLSWFDLRFRRGVERLFDKVKAPLPLFYEPIFVFKPDIKFEGVRKLYIVDGFWQDKKFLSDPFVADVRGAISKVRRTQGLKMPDDNAVCIHIRRGDYLTNRHWFRRQQVALGLDYYEAAMDYMKHKDEFSQFHVYTDDERWVKEIFSDRPEVSVIPSSHLSPSQLLAQMTQYRHFVIANSTLSWWAAVLSDALPKLVVCPKKWGISLTSRDLSLTDWVVI